MFFIFYGSNLAPIKPMFAVFAVTYCKKKKNSLKRNVIKKTKTQKNF